MTGIDTKIRFIRFVEKSDDETKEMWLITTLNKGISSKTVWKMMHKRWHIENSGFHHLKTEWHLDHCFLYHPTGTEAVAMFLFIAFNLLQLFFFRCLRNFKEKGLLQIDIIEDLWDEMIIYKNKNGYFLDTT